MTSPATPFTDTHCHIHEGSYVDAEAAYRCAVDAGVGRLICVGTDAKSSLEAVGFARAHENVWACVGIHPHDAKTGLEAIKELEQLLQLDRKDHVDKIVAIGECGLDYFYDNSPRDQQIDMLKAQLQLARDYDLPVIFHVRDSKNPNDGSVWADFWPILDSYKALRGVLHSYTDNLSNLEQATSRGLYIGVNGISTFARDKMEIYEAIPLTHLLLETDAPYLTPVPHRGTVNEPAFTTHIAQHLANLRSISLEELSRATERNATNIFLKNQ